MAFKEVDAGREAELSCVRFGGGNCSWSLQECRCTSLHEERSSRKSKLLAVFLVDSGGALLAASDQCAEQAAQLSTRGR